MAKFVFRLQQHLSIKEKIESQRKIEYGSALAALAEEQSKEAALETEKADKTAELSVKVREQIEPDLFEIYNSYIELLKKRIIGQREKVLEAEMFAEEKRLVLVEAMKEKKALQRLKEKDFEVFKEEEKRIEQSSVDEIVSYRYNLNNHRLNKTENGEAGETYERQS